MEGLTYPGWEPDLDQGSTSPQKSPGDPTDQVEVLTLYMVALFKKARPGHAESERPRDEDDFTT